MLMACWLVTEIHLLDCHKCALVAQRRRSDGPGYSPGLERLIDRLGCRLTRALIRMLDPFGGLRIDAHADEQPRYLGDKHPCFHSSFLNNLSGVSAGREGFP